MLRPTPSRSRTWPGFEQRDHLLEEAADALRLGLVAADGDLVAAHVDRDGERVLDDAQQLVALTEQAHHEVVARYEDLDLGRRRCWHVGDERSRGSVGRRLRLRGDRLRGQAVTARRPSSSSRLPEIVGAAAHHRGEHPEVVAADREHLAVEVLALELDRRRVAGDHRGVGVVDLVQPDEVDGEAVADESAPVR